MEEQVTPLPVGDIAAIQTKPDGSFLLQFNGYPFHATKDDTPEVYAEVIKLLAGGAEHTEYAEPSVPPEVLAEVERAWRDQELQRVSWLRDRHRDELELERETTLSQTQYVALISYLQRLRDWPQAEHFPSPDHRPIVPDWINEQAA